MDIPINVVLCWRILAWAEDVRPVIVIGNHFFLPTLLYIIINYVEIVNLYYLVGFLCDVLHKAFIAIVVFFDEV